MHQRLLPLLLWLALVSGSHADIVINEIVHAASQRVVKWDAANVPSLGTGPMWYKPTFVASSAKGWQSAPGPFGFGTFNTGTPTFGLNTQTQMQYLTPTLYLRKEFTVSPTDAVRTDPLQLQVDYNDGFILYINGVEVARRWAGPANQIHYHDQPSYDPDLNGTTQDITRYTETINLGAASTRLVSGTNLIAIHALNIASTNNNFYYGGTLRIGGASPTTLVTSTEQHQYLIGVVEPAGGLYDPALLGSGRLNAPWAKTTYVDTGWLSATGPIGQGSPSGGTPLGTTIGGAVGVTPSLYTRIVFNATEAQSLDPAGLQLVINYDDGFVAYINGIEVARSSNLQTPNTFTPRTAVANAAGNYATTTTITLDPANKLLRSGSNVLAIQVHNVSINDPDLFIKADLKTAANATLVPYNSNQWKYLVGTKEPVDDGDGALEDSPDLPESVTDWIELHNNGATDVSIAGWGLSDAAGEPFQWTFPAGTVLPAGAYLVVICDGEDIAAPAPNGYLHTNFKIDADGEYVGLVDSNGTIIQQFTPKIPKGHPHYGLIRNAGSQYVYSDVATPGAANAGNEFAGIVAAPVASKSAGYYTGSQVITLSSATPGANIRYTTDGSEPTATTGTAYTNGANLPITVTTALRTRAFLAGSIPSAVTTENYILNDAAHAVLPSVTLTGSESRSLYRPFGVMAIKEAAIGTSGNFTSEGTPWTALGDFAQYNNPNIRGKFMERPVTWQMLYPGNTTSFTTDIGLRMAGSPYTRPRYTIPDQNRVSLPNSGAWPTGNSLRKPSMNFYMRNDLGGDPLDFPIIPNSPVTKHSDFRFRSGHNDLNPFIIDELMRRLYANTGQLGSLGANVNLFVNGVYKGLYNLCQHVREEWCREAFGSDLQWDVIQVGVPSDGDLLALQETMTFLLNNNQSVLANFQAMQTRVNMVNFIDYLLVNIYGATGDWPHNNWICARERSTTGKFNFFVWDAEGAFGGFSLNVRSNNFTENPNNIANDRQSSLKLASGETGGALNTTPRGLYALLRNSPEFKLLFADRIQKHFFNDGGLTNAAILARNAALVTECSPFIPSFNSTRIPNWINGTGDVSRYNGSSNNPSRRRVLLDGYTDDTNGGNFVTAHFVGEGLWPTTKAPTFSQHGGAVGAGISLTINNPNPAGTIYYTTNGTDPRAPGGAIAGTAYAAPFPVSQTTTVKARVRNTNNEWSPLLEATFSSTNTPSLLITEIMYNPPDFNGVNGAEFEFIEIKNVGATTVDLFGMHFSQGIDFTFPAGSTLPPAEFVVLAKNPDQFALKYPGIPVLGSYGPSSSLDNAGETITLVDAANNEIFSVKYDDKAPWPLAADGGGPSLVPNFPNTNPDPDDSTNWRISGNENGSPGTDDPAPGVPKIQITEVLANSVPPALDAVELYNGNAAPANIGGWYLSDDLATPKKYRIPDNTIIPAGGYLVLTETAFNTGPTAFAFSQNGDQAVLSSANASDELNGYTEYLNFGASEPGVTFGRYTNTETPAPRKFVTALKQATLGGPNTGPKIGPMILSEIHYYPSGSAAEFIEIRNNSNTPIPLFDPANPQNAWRVSGINYTLPTGVTIQPREFIILSANAPGTFRSSYAVPTSVQIFGPFNPPGDLSNTGERVILQKPGLPYLDDTLATVVPYIDIDAVTYSSTWFPTTANGGRSLERAYPNHFADDKSSWKASSANGGNTGRFGPLSFSTWQAQWFSPEDLANVSITGPTADPDGDGYANLLEYGFGTLPTLTDAPCLVSASLVSDGGTGPYLAITFRRSLATQNTSVNLFIDNAGTLPNWVTTTIQVGVAVKNNDGTETVVFRDSVLFNSEPSRFLRVRATP